MLNADGQTSNVHHRLFSFLGGNALVPPTERIGDGDRRGVGASNKRFGRLRMLSELVAKMSDRFLPRGPGSSSRGERSAR